jgi:hypothetical protein
MNFNGGDGILEMVTWVHDADVPGAAGTGDWLEAGSGAAPTSDNRNHSCSTLFVSPMISTFDYWRSLLFEIFRVGPRPIPATRVLVSAFYP